MTNEVDQARILSALLVIITDSDRGSRIFDAVMDALRGFEVIRNRIDLTTASKRDICRTLRAITGEQEREA